MAVEVWQSYFPDGKLSGEWQFDVAMKSAQLRNCKIEESLILLDEAQDMDACQIDCLVRQQTNAGKDVFVVGDCAQAIYGFRGASPASIIRLGYGGIVSQVVDLSLTHSWSFGPNIAAVANLVLHCKEKSPQASTWQRYVVKGCGADKGRVMVSKGQPCGHLVTPKLLSLPEKMHNCFSQLCVCLVTQKLKRVPIG